MRFPPSPAPLPPLLDRELRDRAPLTPWTPAPRTAFTEGQRITHVDKVDEGWWSGRNAETGAEGLFPSNYVEEL